MKSIWVLLSTLALSSTVAATGVAGVAAAGADAAAPRIPQTISGVPALLPTSATDGLYLLLAAPQDVVPGTVFLVRGAGHKVSDGTRTDRQFYEISSTGSNDVPSAALNAYKNAEKIMATADPGCQISWTLLAAIGRVESDHGRFGGAHLSSDGVSRPEIRGPQLNGAGPFAAIHDSDNGVLDHDRVWDRAVGQMQFLPQTWQSVARDGDGDGRMNPDDIDDSALGSAVYLCGVGGSLADSAGMARAAFRYNHSDYYVQLVLSFVTGYRTGVFTLPSPPPPPADTRATARARASATARAKAQALAKKAATQPPATQTPAAKPLAPKPTPKPTPTPTPSSAPSPTGPTLVQVNGTWNACGGGFCLGDSNLDVGSAGALGGHASSDFDGDGSVESNTDEFSGLTGQQVSLQVERTPGGMVVYVIEGKGYRNGDGSFARSMSVVSPSPSTAP